MALANQQLAVGDFTGGITDYVLDAQENQSATLENLLVNKNRKLESVPGSDIYNALYPQIPDGNVRVTAMFKSLDPQLYVSSSRKIWYPGASAWTQLLGPTGNPALSVGTTATFLSTSEWNGHTYCVTSDYATPIKIFRNSSSVPAVRTAGLPDLASSPSVNSSSAVTVTFTVTSANATSGAIYQASNGSQFTVTTTIAPGTTLTTTSVGSVPPSGTLTKLSGTGDATITYTSVTSPTNNYIYAFHYEYTYNVNGTTTFQDLGPVTYISRTYVPAPSATSVSITGIPVLANGTTLNYETAVVKIFIYRTANNGLTLYKIGEVTNGTTTFTDNFTDASITTNLLLYTNGGTLDYDPPPACKFVHVVNGVAYYANVKSGSNYYTNQIRQSIPGDPDSAPELLTIDLLEEIVGISSFNDNPIVFSKKRVYRLNGLYDELGQGQVTFEDITKTVGCMSHNSIVQTRDGVFWAGDDGFYWTDGFNFKKISDTINERYKKLVSSDTRKSRIYATFDTVDNKIHWACTSGDASTDNDCFFTLDLRWGISDRSTFTTRVGGTSFAPTAVLYYGNDLLRADKRGYVFKHNSAFTTDPKVNPLTAYSTWPKQSIIPVYLSTIFNFGLPMVRKWVPKTLLSMKNVSDVSVQISAINDNSTTMDDLLEIRVRGNLLWGDLYAVWGASTPNWNDSSLIEQIRRFPAGSLRCSFKQIQITQSYTNIYNSDTFGIANTNSTTKVASITANWPSDSVDYYITFDTDGYTKQYLVTGTASATTAFTLSPVANATAGAVYQAVNGNLYTVSSTISGGSTLNTVATGVPPTSGVLTKISGTGDSTITFTSMVFSPGQLTYLDPLTSQPTGTGVKWLVKGYPKGEVFNILSYVLYYAPLTDQSYRTYRTEQDSSGANS
jgi:hypothetical protein